MDKTRFSNRRKAIYWMGMMGLAGCAALANAEEVFPWEEMSGGWTWNANAGLLKGQGAVVVQSTPDPKSQKVTLSFPDGGTSMIISGQGETVTLPAVEAGEPAWEWAKADGKTLTPEEVEVLLDKPQTELPRWKGTHTTKEGVKVAYRLFYVTDRLLFGLMDASREGLSFSRTFTFTR